ncbi:hypothetical protein X798_01051 [Onchocerca flexuosa]|uniref:Uncharacterized protein n=1 Tax=Onchocerca flexuosa TaxID=387005 RepID=A0A238C489_9BILA|nr:hypothetical protein X798_01051 [Onchocerca flexuosa]
MNSQAKFSESPKSNLENILQKAFICLLSNTEEINQLVDKANELMAGFDGLICNAGIAQDSLLLKMTKFIETRNLYIAKFTVCKVFECTMNNFQISVQLLVDIKDIDFFSSSTEKDGKEKKKYRGMITIQTVQLCSKNLNFVIQHPTSDIYFSKQGIRSVTQENEKDEVMTQGQDWSF